MYREKIIERLQKLIDVNTPIIYIHEYDTIRINSIIREAISIPDKEIYEWNPGTCLTDFWNLTPKDEIFSANGIKASGRLDNLIKSLYDKFQRGKLDSPSIFILREVQDYIDTAPLKSLLASIAQRKLYDSRFELTVLIVSSVVNVPEELMPYVSFLEIDFPNDDEILKIIYRHLYVNEMGSENVKETFKDRSEIEIDNIVKEYLEEKHAHMLHQVDDLLPNFRGMSPFEIDRMVDRAMSRNGTLGADDYKMILEHKKELVKKSGVLELVESDVSIEDIGGLENLKTYLTQKAIIRKYSKEASDSGITLPKGIFLVGMPGCGKSLSAQATASMFQEPLLKLDMGTLMGSKVGESEKNLRKAIKIAEAAAPCVLWVDEIEKGFAGSNNDDNAYLRRMFGYFLSWLQDKKSAVYVIATANNLEKLPMEFKRKGRFDDMFFVDLPNEEECKAIFDLKINKVIKKREQKEGNFDFKTTCDLIKYVAGKPINKEKNEEAEKHHFCGADIEYVVNHAFEMIFRKSKIQASMKQIQEEINGIRSILKRGQHEEDRQLLEQKNKELERLKKFFIERNNKEEYQEYNIIVPDGINQAFLLKIAQNTKCIGMSSDDESFRIIRDNSPSKAHEKSPYLSASETPKISDK